MDLELQDKVVVVTGGSKGIGEAIVSTFLAEGAQVVNVNRSEPSTNPAAHYIQADLCDLKNCEKVIHETLDRYGRLDALVNNAGVNDGVGIEAGTDAFMNSLEKNLIHFYALVHHAIDALKRSRGSIVNVGSKVAVTGQGGTSGYAAAKGAINGLTREWALDFAPDGVRVNAVLPAEVWTPLYEKCLSDLPDPQEEKARIERLIPLEGRFTTSQELADMVVFLASPRSGHTTGQIIFVDGGYTHLDRKATGVKDA